MSVNYRMRRPENRPSTFEPETFNIDEALDALSAGGVLAPAPGGPRARRRAARRALAKGGLVAPLLAAQGCFAVGKGELPLAGPDASAGAGAGASSGAAAGRSGASSGEAALPPAPVAGGQNDAGAQSDRLQASENESRTIDVGELLANDIGANGGSLEIVRVFNAVNGTVMLDGAIIEFIPDEGYDGVASFQYEVRDSAGNLTVASVEIDVAPADHGGMHGGDHGGMHGGDDGMHGGDGGHSGMHGDDHGGHAHPDDPAKAAEHMALLNLVPVSEATHVAVNNGSWFDPNSWANGEVPGAGAKVVIPSGVKIVYDGQSDASLFTVRVDGMMEFATDRDTFMEADTVIVSPTGHLTIGTIDDPLPSQFNAVIQIADNGPIDVSWDPALLSRGLISHGKIEIHGAEKDTFLRLAADPMRGDTSLVLEEAPEGWAVGDRLVLTGTELGEYTRTNDIFQDRNVVTQDEELIITRIEGTTIHFADPLVYDHAAPRDDLKAYVANYSRNVQVVTENADGLPPSQRGHVMFMHSGEIDVRYGEFTDLGRTDKSERSFDPDDVATVASDTNMKGRYSLHIHRAGVSDQDDPVMIVGNAVWGSPGWGYVHHDSNAIFADNAAYDVFGAAFVAESGNETGRWVSNISIKNGGTSGYGAELNSPKVTEDVMAFDLGRNGAGFWFQGRQVDAIGNVAAGSPGGHGFVYFHRGGDGNVTSVDTLNNPEIGSYHDETIDNGRPSISQFEGNEAIGVGVGFIVIKSDWRQGHDQRSMIEDFTAWEVYYGVHNEYTAHYSFTNADLIGAGDGRALVGLDFGSAVNDIVIVDAQIDGFNSGISAAGDPSSRQFIVVGGEIINLIDGSNGPGEAYRNFTDEDTILSAEELLALSQSAGPLAFESGVPIFTNNLNNLVGVKSDTLGEFQVGEFDHHFFRNTTDKMAAFQEGYWTTESGLAVTAVERVFADRVTGEEIKVSTFISTPGLGWAQTSGATYHGVLDLNSAAPVAGVDVITVGEGGRITFDALANDFDPDGDSIWIDGFGEATHGSVWVQDDGRITYESDPNFTGEDEFYYWLQDDNGVFTQGLVQVTVEA
ncbi:MAG: cadherin-like domain-containing protein [Pseudomonadota bacterium]